MSCRPWDAAKRPNYKGSYLPLKNKIKSQERDLAQSLHWSRLHFIGCKHLHVRDFARGWTFCATIFHFPEPLEKVCSAGMCSISFPIYITTGLRKLNQVTWGQSSWIKQSYRLGAALFACHFLLLFWYCFSCLCFGAPGLGRKSKNWKWRTRNEAFAFLLLLWS